MKALRQASAETGKAVAELIRQGVDRFLATGLSRRARNALREPFRLPEISKRAVRR